MWPLLSTLHLLIFLVLIIRHFSLSNSLLLPNRCNETCGDFVIPFPFHLNSSCPAASATSSSFNAFRLSCAENATSLYLTVGDNSSSDSRFRVVEFYPDGLLLDVSPSSSLLHRRYEDLNLFEVGSEGRRFFGVSEDNVVGLYDCEDTSVCRAECEGGGGGGSPECCYPLSDHSVWRVGDAGFSAFGRFGCRGFSSWAGPTGRPGLKLEWAVPRNLTPGGGVCHGNASVVNATAVRGGVRCLCREGFVGDGFLMGNGCVSSCVKDRREVYGSEYCNQQKHNNNDKKFVIIAGVLSSAFIVASLAALFFLLKQPEHGKPDYITNQYNNNNNFNFNFPGDVDEVSLRKACRARLFSRSELEQATQGFQQQHQQSSQLAKGVLSEGTLVAVHTVCCRSETDLIQVLSRVEALSLPLLHRNLARVVGCCLDDPAGPMVVYERPPNGTLEDRLPSLDWPRRLRVAVEISSALAFLHHDTDPPMPHRGLGPASVFLDDAFSAKLAGFGLASLDGDEKKGDVWGVGTMLAEMVTGRGCHVVALQRMMSYGRVAVEEVVDPGLYFHEMPGTRRDQVQNVADLAARCLMFDRRGTIRMGDVARELVRIAGDIGCCSSSGSSKRGQGLEETFSNSSLLQMISMSPDSIYLP